MVLCLVNVGSNSINISPNTPLKFNSQIPKMTPSLKPEILPKQTAADAKDFLRSEKKSHGSLSNKLFGGACMMFHLRVCASRLSKH